MVLANDWCNLQADETYGFPLTRGTVTDRQDVWEGLAEELGQGLVNPAYIARTLERCGMHTAAEYFKEHGFGRKLNTRVGDFGEVAAGRLLEHAEGLVQPIRKLRYRETGGWAMRLTDVFSVALSENGISLLCFTSVKSSINAPDSKVGIAGYEQLAEDATRHRPEILHFVTARLYDEGQWDLLERFEQIETQSQPPERAFRLALVFDLGAWKEDPLANLDEHIDDPLPGFQSYLLLASDLRSRLSECYVAAEQWCLNQ